METAGWSSESCRPAGLAQDQHAGIGGGHHFDLAQQGLQRRAFPDNRTEGTGFDDLFPEVGVLIGSAVILP